MIKEVNSPEGIDLVSLFAGQAEQALNACVSLQRQVILWQGRAEGVGRLNEELQNEVGKLQAQCKRLDREREECASLEASSMIERVTFLQSDQKIRAADQGRLSKDLADVKRTLEKRDAELANVRGELQAEKENAPLNALRETVANLENEKGKSILEVDRLRNAVCRLQQENKGLRDENASLKVSAEKYQNHAEHLKAQNEAVESKVQRLEEERQKLSAQVESMKVGGFDHLSPEKVEELFAKFLPLQKLGQEEISRLVTLHRLQEENGRLRAVCEACDNTNAELRADNADLRSDVERLKESWEASQKDLATVRIRKADGEKPTE